MYTLSKLFLFNRIPIIVVIFLINTALISPVLSQKNCIDTLIKAQQSYNDGFFNSTIELIKPCLADGFETKQHKQKANRYMALAFIELNYPDSARKYIQNIINLDDSFEADLEKDPLIFIDIVDESKPSWYSYLYSWIYSGNEWYKWGGRVVLSGGLLYLAIEGEGERPNALNGPPSLP